MIIQSVMQQVELGESKSIEKTISESDIYLYAGIVGDFHPNHMNERYASEKLGGRVAHGALLVGFVSRCTVELVGNRLNPPGYVAQSFNTKCVLPVYIGDTIKTTVTVKEKLTERRKILMDVTIYNQHGDVCAVGDTVIKVLKEKTESQEK